MRKSSLFALVFAVAGLAGCASNPPLSELRQKNQTATFIQHGTKPVHLGFGVVDTASFWAASGSGIGGMSGGWAWPIVGQLGQNAVDKRKPTDAELIAYLYNDHPIAVQSMQALMPLYGNAFGVKFDSKDVLAVDASQPLEDKDGYLTGMTPTTDLVLAATLHRLILTEKLSFGGALKAGFSFGTNTKQVTGEGYMQLRAYQREPATGRYKRVWLEVCAAQNMHMDINYPFPEVVQSRDKAKEIWDETQTKLIDNCSKFLTKVATS